MENVGLSNFTKYKLSVLLKCSRSNGKKLDLNFEMVKCIQIQSMRLIALSNLCMYVSVGERQAVLHIGLALHCVLRIACL